MRSRNQRSPLSGYHWLPDEGIGYAGEGEEAKEDGAKSMMESLRATVESLK
ncbi:MAG: hypothetical protein ABR985_17780 [Methanotrichaceae archaeon]